MRKAYYALPIVLMLLAGAASSRAQDGKKGSLTAQDYVEIQMLYRITPQQSIAGTSKVLRCSRQTSFKPLAMRACATFMKRTAGLTPWNTNLLSRRRQGAKGAVS